MPPKPSTSPPQTMGEILRDSGLTDYQKAARERMRGFKDYRAKKAEQKARAASTGDPYVDKLNELRSKMSSGGYLTRDERWALPELKRHEEAALDAQDAEDRRWANTGDGSYIGRPLSSFGLEDIAEGIDHAAYVAEFHPKTTIPAQLWLGGRAAHKGDPLEFGIYGAALAASPLAKIPGVRKWVSKFVDKAGSAVKRTKVIPPITLPDDSKAQTPEQPPDRRDWSGFDKLHRERKEYPFFNPTTTHPKHVPEGDYFGKGIIFPKGQKLSRDEEYSRRKDAAIIAAADEAARVEGLDPGDTTPWDFKYNPDQSAQENLRRRFPDLQPSAPKQEPSQPPQRKLRTFDEQQAIREERLKRPRPTPRPLSPIDSAKKHYGRWMR